MMIMPGALDKSLCSNDMSYQGKERVSLIIVALQGM